jgi:hypothetical protein
MKKKIILITLMIMLFVCTLAISVSAAHLQNFINVDLELTDGTTVEAYLKKGDKWNGYQGYDRSTLYADYTDTSKTISWSQVKVFDGRKSEICTYDGTTFTKTGTYPQTLLKGPSGQGNVTHFYYPQGAVVIASNSFLTSRGWTSLEYLWIPKSLVEISETVCKENTVIKTIDIEEGSALKKVGNSAFYGCTNLTSFDFSRVPNLEVVDYCGFYNTAIGGTVILPNTVTTVGAAAFRKTKVEVLVLGDGPITLGNNIVGDESTYNNYLREIYIPIEATFAADKLSQMWYKSTNETGLVDFYVIAKEGQDTSAFIESLKGTGRVTFATEEEIENGTAPSGYNAVIKLGYNKCKAFYGDVHTYGEAEYAFHGFTNGAELNQTCEKCNKTEKTADFAPMIELIGYSAKIGSNKICVGYKLSAESVSQYKIATGETISFGVVAIMPIDEDELKPLYVENGEVKAIDYTISASFSTTYLTFFGSLGNTPRKGVGVKYGQSVSDKIRWAGTHSTLDTTFFAFLKVLVPPKEKLSPNASKRVSISGE